MLAVCSMEHAAGQTLSLSSAAGKAGDWVTVEIAWRPSPGPAVVALQWDTAIPSGHSEFENQVITRAVLAVKDAGKSLNCLVAGATSEARRLRCILAGAETAIPTGTIVLMALKLSPTAQPGAARIRAEHILGVTRDLKQVPLADAEGTVTIRPR